MTSHNNSISRRGFTLVEAMVGTVLMVIVFLGIFGAYRLALKVVSLSKNKITATAIANSRIEEIRNLPYESVGTVGAILPAAAGDLESVYTKTSNDGSYTITTDVNYVIDAADGTGASDSCDWDYKRVDVTVSWGGVYSGSVNISTDVTPKNLVQEIQSCASQPGGVLRVTVFDALGIAVTSPSIEIYDESGGLLVDSAIPSNGEYSFALPAGTYRVNVSKNLYASTRTYGSAEVAVPDSPNPTVLEGFLTPLSLSIDLASAISVDSVSPTGQDYFADPFDDGSHIAANSNTQVITGALTLSGPVYPASGWAVSETITPADIVAWNEFDFSETNPAGTDISYQIYYYDGVDWQLIPDADLAGNGSGFFDSPVNLAGLNKNTYPQLRVKANLISTNPSATPSMESWQVVWTTSTGVAVPDVTFELRGTKTIGEDSIGDPVFKYNQENTLDGAGHLDIDGVDGDSYTFSVNATSGFALIATEPSPQPVNIIPGDSVSVKLFLQAQNALLVTAQDDIALTPVFSAPVRLYSASLGYDKTQYTDADGQVYFAPLQNGTYDIQISAPGYSVYAGTVAVSGAGAEIIPIHLIQ